MNLISIALLSLYLTGIVKGICIYEEFTIRNNNVSKNYIVSYRIGYIVSVVIWPLIAIYAFTKTILTYKSKESDED